MIEVSELYKYYGAKRALGPISFTVESGEIVGLLGLNGAGKTTTLRILACDLLPTSGSVKIGGTDLAADQDGVRARIGYLPDTPPLYGEMSVQEYLVFAARLRGLSTKAANQRAAEVSELTEIRDLGSELIGSLSHGYKQRVGIAQAIVHKPALVLLDEPISGLDPVQIVEMRRLVRNLRGEHTVVISSHILTEISETCDTLLVLRDGQIVAVGSERELSERLVQGQRLEVTVKRPATVAPEAAKSVLVGLPGIKEVTELAASEPGESISSFRIVAERDVREDACRLLFDSGFGLLELRRTQRELESIFLELSGTPTEHDGAEAAPRGEAAGTEEPTP